MSEDERKNRRNAWLLFSFGILFSLIGFAGTYILASIDGRIEKLTNTIDNVQKSVNAEHETNVSQAKSIERLEALHPIKPENN